MVAVTKHAAHCVMHVRNTAAVVTVAKASVGCATPRGCDVFQLVARPGAPALTLTAAELTACAGQLPSVVLGRGAAAAAVIDAVHGSLTLFFATAATSAARLIST